MGSDLHTTPEVNNTANLASVADVNECRTGTSWLP
jgi:hypothetical protein